MSRGITSPSSAALRAALVLAVLATAGESRADRRYYVRGYQYATMEPEEMELEWYVDFDDRAFADSSGDKWVHQFELEYGLTDRWDVSLYAVFRQDSGQDLRYHQTKLRTRYRLAERGRWPVDVLLYAEYKLPADLRKGNAFEEKVIVARDLGRFNAAVNLIAEQEWDKVDSRVLLKFGYTLGASYEIAPAARFGLELFGEFRPIPSVAHQAWVGPVISVGGGGKFWLSAGFGVQLNEASDQFRFRSILGIYL